MDRYKSFGPLRERCRPEINSSREVATRERCGKIFHPCSVPPQKAGGENVVFKMNNSPVTPLPSLPPLYTRILDTEREEIATTDWIVTAVVFAKKKNGHLLKEKKKNICQNFGSKLWLVGRWLAAGRTKHVFQEQFLENLPSVALCNDMDRLERETEAQSLYNLHVRQVASDANKRIRIIIFASGKVGLETL